MLPKPAPHGGAQLGLVLGCNGLDDGDAAARVGALDVADVVALGDPGGEVVVCVVVQAEAAVLVVSGCGDQVVEDFGVGARVCWYATAVFAWEAGGAGLFGLVGHGDEDVFGLVALPAEEEEDED